MPVFSFASHGGLGVPQPPHRQLPPAQGQRKLGIASRA